MQIPKIRLFILLQCLLAGILLFILSSAVVPFTIDSIVYITTAQHISQWQGLICTNFFVEQAKDNFIHSFLQPPGYPLLISLFKLIKIDEFTAAIFIPRACFVVAPFLFFLIFKRFITPFQAVVASFLSTFMFSMVESSLMAWSDMPYLTFSLLAILASFYIIDQKGKLPAWIILFAGALVGVAFLIRLVGLTLMVSIILGWMIAVILKQFSIRDFIKTIVFYGAGIALVVAPYFLRNWLVFKNVQTFQVGPSQVGLLMNIGDFLEGLSEQFFLLRSWELGIGLIGLGIGTMVFIRVRELFQTQKAQLVCLIILVVYFFLDSFNLIALKTMFLSPGHIEGRYLIQVSWILIMALVWVFNYFGNLLPKKHLNQTRIKVFLIISFVLMQGLYLMGIIKAQGKLVALSKTAQIYAPIIQKIPEDLIIVANMADIAYFHFRRNVRMLSNYTPDALVKVLTPKKKFVVFVFKGAQNARGDWGWYSPLWDNPSGYERIFSNEDIDILSPRLIQM